MTIATCDVVCSLLDPSSNPVEGARITARLTSHIVNASLIVPLVEYSTTNGHGSCTLPLVPNSTSGSHTTYTFEILLPGAKAPTYFHDITVPAVATITLAELLGWTGSGGGSFLWNDTAIWDDTQTWAEA